MFRFDKNINWKRVAESIDFYQKKGYEYIEVPWIITEEVLNVTFTGNAPKFQNGFIVGSAEQSFIQMMFDEELKKGNYVAASPCFRNETEHVDLHYPYFFKVELIHFGVNAVEECIGNVRDFYIGLGIIPKIIDTNEGQDLCINGIEVGSYGFRKYKEYKEYKWTYGTGLAEPRFSQALEKK